MSLAKFFTLLRVVTVALCVAMFLALMVEVWKQVRLSSLQMLATMTLWKHQLPLKYFEVQQHWAGIALGCEALWELLVLLAWVWMLMLLRDEWRVSTLVVVYKAGVSPG